jgi:hypothetical protein
MRCGDRVPDDIVQEIAPNKAAALNVAIGIATGSLPAAAWYQATSAVPHVALDETADPAAYTKLEADYVAFSVRRISQRGARLKPKTGLRSSKDSEERDRHGVGATTGTPFPGAGEL